MKHIKLSTDSNVKIIGTLKSTFNQIIITNLEQVNGAASVVIPIIIGRSKMIYNNNLWSVCDPWITEIQYPMLRVHNNELKLERYPDIGAYSIFYENKEVLTLALSGEMIDDIEYCNILIRYDEDIFDTISPSIIS